MSKKQLPLSAKFDLTIVSGQGGDKELRIQIFSILNPGGTVETKGSVQNYVASKMLHVRGPLAVVLCGLWEGGSDLTRDSFAELICAVHQAGVRAQLAKNKEVMNKLLGS